MFNIFLCIAWPIIIFISILAYRLIKKKYSSTTSIIIAGLTFVISVFVVSNIFAMLYSMRLYDIQYFFIYPRVFLFSSGIVQ